jgi:AAA domain
MTIDELRACITHPMRWLVEHLFPTPGVSLFVGASMAGKTALDIATSSGAIEGLSVLSGPALYLLLEHQFDPVVQLADKAARAAGLSQSPIRVVTDEINLLSEDDAKAIANEADRIGAVKVTIDSLRSAWPGDENDASTAHVVMKHARIIADGQRAVVLPHHPGKNGTFRGSTAFKANADSYVELHRQRDFVLLTAEHHHAAPMSVRLRKIITDDSLRFAVDSAVSNTTHDPEHARVVTAIADVLRHEYPKCIGRNALGKLLRKHGVAAGSEQIDRALGELADNGVIERTVKGARSLATNKQQEAAA